MANPTPGIRRRLVCVLYEGLVVFSILLIGFLLPQIVLSGFGFSVPPRMLWIHVVLLLMIYFVWCWLNGGQTLPMKTWKLVVVNADGTRLRPAQAILRYLAAWPGVIIVAVLIFGINLLWPTISFSPDMSGFVERMSSQMSSDQLAILKSQIEVSKTTILWQTFLQALIAGITINAVAGFGEELGWRGYLVREYKEDKFWIVSLRIGFIWGLWHAPIILMGHNYPQHPVLGVGMMIVWCMLISPVILYIRIKTHSVIGAAIMHGTINASAGIPLMFIAGGNDLTAGATGFTGMIGIAVVILIMIAYDTRISKHPVTNKTLLEAIKQ